MSRVSSNCNGRVSPGVLRVLAHSHHSLWGGEVAYKSDQSSLDSSYGSFNLRRASSHIIAVDMGREGGVPGVLRSNKLAPPTSMIM